MPAANEQAWSPADYHRHARFVSDLGMPVVELLDPRCGERILDLGCGDGALSIKLAQLGCELVCVDSSDAMVEAARSLGLDARFMDGCELAYDGEFDAVFSNAALHWMKHPEKVVSGVWRALKPGGRFVAEFGGRGNVAMIVAAMQAALAKRGLTARDPWFFPTVDEYRAMLEHAGFCVEAIELIPRPTPLPGDIGGWLKTFAQPFTAVLPAAQRPGFIREVVDALRGKLSDDNGKWHADYVRLRFAAGKSFEPVD